MKIDAHKVLRVTKRKEYITDILSHRFFRTKDKIQFYSSF